MINEVAAPRLMNNTSPRRSIVIHSCFPLLSRLELFKRLGVLRGQFRQVLYSHPHNIGGPEILDQMIELTDEILSGRNDDASAILFMGKPALVAKPVDTETLLRRDGKLANATYDPGNLT